MWPKTNYCASSPPTITTFGAGLVFNFEKILGVVLFGFGLKKILGPLMALCDLWVVTIHFCSISLQGGHIAPLGYRGLERLADFVGVLDSGHSNLIG